MFLSPHFIVLELETLKGSHFDGNHLAFVSMKSEKHKIAGKNYNWNRLELGNEKFSIGLKIA